MNQLAPISSTAIGAASIGLPRSASIDPEDFHEATGQLGSAIRTLRRGVALEISPALADEARRHLEHIRPLCELASDATILEWLRAMGAGVAKAGDEARNVAARVQAVFATCRHLPVGVWTEQTRVAFWAKHRWWPEPADLLAFLAPYAETLRRQRAGCEALRTPSSVGDGQEGEVISLEQRRAMGADFKRRATAAIAEGAALLAIPGGDAARKPIARTRTDDLARLEMLKARSENEAMNPVVRAACAQAARELRARLLGGVRA